MTDKAGKDDKTREAEITAAGEQILKHQDKKNALDRTAEPNTKAVGVDIGTSKIVFAQKKNGRVDFLSQRNAFIAVDFSKFTESILNQNRINHIRNGKSLIVYGDGAEIFANMLNTETRRPMHKGLLNPKETYAIEIIKGILDDLLAGADSSDVQLNFSIPDVPKDCETDIIYHEAILKRHLSEKGFKTKSINEGLAVVFAELEDENFTGLGISAGGGMCNVCLAYLSVPLISFSINKGGDYIDDAVASVTGAVNTRVRSIKENGFDLKRKPRNEIEDALHIYYDELIMSLVRSLKESISQTSSILNVDRPIPIVLSGGTVKPGGFKERFEHFLKEEEIPLDFGRIRIADDPLNATAKGTLIAAMHEG
ncbi:MAG: hypothetical protein JSW39_10515 [Desulfobacterales bacterium]|nr:MAG: hypothetical protein JSW39_10515 [Desulfobacterales bacterium]